MHLLITNNLFLGFILHLGDGVDVRDEVHTNVGDQNIRDSNTLFSLVIFQNTTEGSFSGAESTVQQMDIRLFLFTLLKVG